MLGVLCLLPASAMAWYGGGYPAPPYAPYDAPYYGYYGEPGYPGYNNWFQPYGYAEPRWYFKGRMNQYGDYEFRIRLENVNPNDLYNAWLWFQYNQH